MKHECWWDEERECVRFKIVGELSAEEAEQLMDQLQELSDSRDGYGLIIDHRLSPRPVGREARAVFERRAKQRKQRDTKIAFFGMNNLNRMIAQIIVSVLGRSKRTQFFASEAEAEAWIST